MTKKMDRRYLEEHRPGVHTLESFGAFVADYAIGEAIERLDGGKAESVEVSVPLRVTSRTVRRVLSREDAEELGEAAEKANARFGAVLADCLIIEGSLGPVTVQVHLAI
ncbi:hypothetical protein SAMN05444920_106202 [Nonomuraea solani]|uniref:Uncharacterized protein n=1 Tax=Nonomuraea solani TaxID=1144553 RepID=A0A1H6DU23_9ACTN|nr:hypothetical protein [Nonomuraea solani]SEG88206.1 hypothetical protein SAMN05444920_106202 [Nonomuraea solani]